jgi:acetoacetyl-CoA synthetase
MSMTTCETNKDAASAQMMAAELRPSMRVRSIERAEIPAVAAFLHGNVDPRPSVAQWQALFDYDWLGAKLDLGFVITIGAEIKGFLGTVYSEREIAGERRMFCNHSTWFVAPEIRGAGAFLLMAATRRPNCIYTNLTASAEAKGVCLKAGFRQIGAVKYLLPPLAQTATLITGSSAVQVTTDPAVVAARLDPAQRRLFEDHRQSCGHLLLEDRDQTLYVITRRRVKRNVPLTEVMHVSAPALFQRHLERVKLAALWRDHTVVLACDDRFLNETPHFAIKVTRPILVKGGPLPDEAIDNLYSELVLLPI